VNNPIHDKENDEHALGFAFHLSRLFPVSVSLDVQCTAHAFFPGCLCSHYQGLSRTFSEICTKFDAVPLSDPSRNFTRYDIKLPIKRRTSTQLRENFVH
jgi:hypothetical protein